MKGGVCSEKSVSTKASSVWLHGAKALNSFASSPLVKTNGKVKTKGKEILFDFTCNCLGNPILRQKIGIFVVVDVGTHGRASLRKKI